MKRSYQVLELRELLRRGYPPLEEVPSRDQLVSLYHVIQAAPSAFFIQEFARIARNPRGGPLRVSLEDVLDEYDQLIIERVHYR